MDKLKEILMRNPDLDVNWKNGGEGDTALHIACQNDRASVVSILLDHPDIDVNTINSFKRSPFLVACRMGGISCVRLLLKDSRVDLSHGGFTPLFWAASADQIGVIKWWIASGKEMDLGQQGDKCADAIGVAKEKRRTEVVTLLERFKENAKDTRKAMRLESSWYDDAAADMFALVVFVSDELLYVKSTPTAPEARFFDITRRLPLDLQMMLCFRLVGSGKEIISGKDSEVAFKSLAKRLLWSSFFAN